MDTIRWLRQQHEHLLAAFDELEITADTEERVRLFAYIGHRLKAHAAAEVEVFYPAIEGSGAPDAIGKVVEARQTHLVVAALLGEILSADAAASTVAVLRRLLERHFAEEERTFFPIVERFEDGPRAALDVAVKDYWEEFGARIEDTPLAP